MLKNKPGDLEGESWRLDKQIEKEVSWMPSQILWLSDGLAQFSGFFFWWSSWIAARTFKPGSAISVFGMCFVLWSVPDVIHPLLGWTLKL